MDKKNPCLSLSVVSHGQLNLIVHLLHDLEKISCKNFEVILSINYPEDEKILDNAYSYPLHIYRNKNPKGFGANHNAAFEHALGEYFAVINPDIRLKSASFNDLIAPMSDITVGAIAPLVLAPAGQIEDSARKFPTFIRLFSRVFGGARALDYTWASSPIDVDWVAGMFIVFRSSYFKKIKGFDEKRFHMYFEDVDICRRIWNQGWKVMLQPRTEVIHDARRTSHRSLKYFRWHLTSCLRYLSGI
jgi:N-acetylglucosaminyl-diphospho-decaprenol L-rhamnosyltransferase